MYSLHLALRVMGRVLCVLVIGAIGVEHLLQTDHVLGARIHPVISFAIIVLIAIRLYHLIRLLRAQALRALSSLVHAESFTMMLIAFNVFLTRLLQLSKLVLTHFD